MTKRFSRLFLLLSGVFYVPALLAQTVSSEVIINAQNPSYTNTGTITTENGYGVFVDGISGFSGELINSGNITVTGTGYGIYETPYQTRPVDLHITNTGTIQRIQLEETDGSIIENGDATTSSPNAVIQGSVLMGVNSKIYNDSGTFENFDLDTAQGGEKSNLISLGRDSQFINGNVYLKQTDIDIGTSTEDVSATISLIQPVYTSATVTTDHIQFAQGGYFDNRSIVNNKSVTFGNFGTLRNTGMAYLVPNSDGTDLTDTGGTFNTEMLSFADNGQVINEMGGTLSAGSLAMGNNALLTNGADYSVAGTSTDDTYYKVLQIITPSEDGTQSDSVEEHFFNPIPQQAVMDIKNVSMGTGSTIDLKNNSVYTGETVQMGMNGVLNITGSSMTLSSDSGESSLTMGANGTINMTEYIQAQVTEPELDTSSDTISVIDKVVLESATYSPKLSVDNLTMGTNGTINLQSGTLNAQKISMVDSGKIIIGMDITTNSDSAESSDSSDTGTNTGSSTTATPLYSGSLTATESLIFGNNGTLISRGFITAPTISFSDGGSLTNQGALTATNIIFGNNGIVNNSGTFNADTLTMGNNAVISTSSAIDAVVTVGSNSVATMVGGGIETSSDILDKNDANFLTAGAFTGGFNKASGAENVQIISNVGFKETETDTNGNSTVNYYHGWLAGGVNVDSILVQQGELWAQDDVRGTIGINTDSTLRLVGTDVDIYDPISKLQDATNTRLIVDLDGDDTFYSTRNSILVDHIILLGGGLQIQNPVQANEITFGSNTTVRLTGNYFVGNMVEYGGDAANTTLDIDAGEGKSINSTGTIQLDRIVVESGTFNINHAVEAVYTADNASMPGSYEQGLELSNNTTVNVNSPDVKVNRIVRNQLALQEGETVENTTVNVNGGHLWVERDTDLDNLNINSGTVEIMNKDGDNVANIGNISAINNGAQLAGAGVINVKNGSLDIGNGGRLSVSTQSTADQPIQTMQIIQSAQTYSDSADITDTGNITVNMAQGSTLDLRADGNTADKIDVSGTVNLADGTRIIVRNIEAGTEYELMSATQLNGNMDRLTTSFLWTGTELSNNNNTLSLKISGIQTLNEGISSTQYSKNVWNIAQALTTINNSTASNTVDPFLENVFYAGDAATAVKVMDEYSPEGYLNAQQMALRTNRTFRQSALSELDAMRTYKDVENMYQNSTPGIYNPNYYGRPGMERYYASWNAQQQSRRRTRTDKGGLWAKPFAVSVSQDDVNNMSGYDISSYGFTAGIDRRFGAVSLGLMGMYATGSIDQNNQVIETDTSTYGFGVYGQYRPYRTRQFFNFYALWTETKNESTHKINSLVESAKADFDLTAYSVGADMGYDMPLTRNIIITPKIGVDYTRVKADEITEKGTGTALLKVKADDMTSIQMPVEIKAAFNYGNELYKFKPEVHARWTHEFGDTESSGEGLFVNYNQPFAVKGLSVDKDVFTLGGSLLWLYGVSELELRYDYDFSSSSTGHTLNVGYKYLF